MAIIAITVALVLAARIDSLLGPQAGGHDPDDRRPTTASSAGTAQPSEDALALPPSDGTWSEAWRSEATEAPGGLAAAEILTNGEMLVVTTPGQKPPTVRGYRVSDAAATESWTIEDPGVRPLAATSGAVIFPHMIVDIATGETAQAPWGQEKPRLILDDLIITCVDTTATCSAWDLAGVTATLRWTRELPGGDTPEFDPHDVAGSTSSGYAMATLDEKLDGLPAVAFISLADGSSQGGQSRADDKGMPLQITPAADGWLRWSYNRDSVLSLDVDGSPSGTGAWTVKYRYAVLGSQGGHNGQSGWNGLPTLNQYQQAHTRGAIGWASTALTCIHQGRADEDSCSLDGIALSVPPGTYSNHLLAITTIRNHRVDQVIDDQWVILTGRNPSDPSPVRIVSRRSHRVVAAPHPLYADDARVIPVRPDLLITVQGNQFVAYAPTPS